MTAKTLYAYTLQPVPYEVSEVEQRQAQLMIWRSTNKFSKKAWMIMIALVVLSLVSAGLILKYYSTYSTVLCWIVMIGVILFYLVKKFGLEWYAKRQISQMPVQEIKGIRLGVQPHGIAMLQKVGLQDASMTVSWKDIYEWYDLSDFILVNFKVKLPKGKGEQQQGAYILPKRMDSKNFPFNTVRKHLNEVVGAPKSI
ncbi:MAG: hypothetical protein RIQ74_1483 [Pseudomonadota bacterium]